MNINEEMFEQQVIESFKLCIVDFYADWCGPCKMLSPVLTEIQQEYPDINIFKVNVDENENLSYKYGVRSIPMLMFFKEGQVLETLVGLKTKQEIINMIKNYNS